MKQEQVQKKAVRQTAEQPQDELPVPLENEVSLKAAEFLIRLVDEA